VDYCLLGSLEVVASGAVVDLGPPKQQAVLAILLLHAGEIVPTDRLIEQVWGKRSPRTAAHSVQLYVSELRKALDRVNGGPVIETRPPGYRLRVEPDRVDLRRFERQIAEGAAERQAGDLPRAVTTLQEALALWRGPPLSEFAYEEFAQPEIHRLEELHLHAFEELAAAELELGREQEALSLLEGVFAQDPLRERARELQMLALYRSGRHAEALRSFQRFAGLLAEEVGLDPSPSLRRLQERILLHDPGLAPEPEPAAGPGATERRNPFKGLQAFEEEDEEDFFGRDGLVERLIEALGGDGRLLAIVGPSGCGKSSVVNAGLLPALRAGALPGSDGWVIAHMVPGGHPFKELEAALMHAVPTAQIDPAELFEGDTGLLRAASRIVRPESRLVLVVDQFEELFSTADEQNRLRFLQNLAVALEEPRAPIRVVLTLRADLYDRPLLHPGFAKVFIPGVVSVAPMTPEELQAAVEGPARRVGVDVEPALMAELVADTTDRPGALPLLQYALTELFERRTSDRLTVDGYRALGGLRAALTRRAEEAHGRLGEEERQAALQVFLRLVRLGEGARDSRRRVPVGELTAMSLDPVALSGALEVFGGLRLLSFDRDPVTGEATVEVAHEALLWEWERLAGWIDRHRADLRRRAALAAAAEEWESSGRQADYLFTGGRLAEHEAWSRDTAVRLTEHERAFLRSGLERRAEEQTQEADRQEAHRNLERRARRRLWGLAGSVMREGRPADVALALEGEGDDSWHGMIKSGFDRAVADLGFEAADTSSLGGAREPEIRRLAEEGVGLIVVAGGLVDLGVIAADYPDTRFVGLDRPDATELPNLSCLVFAEEQGSFLVGAAAALKTETGVVGFVGGVDLPVIRRFQAGFEAGVRAVHPEVEVRSVYLTESPDLTGFDSPTLGWHAARRLYGEGADVVLHAAGMSGFGVFQAAAEAEGSGWNWAIGVDLDQYLDLQALIDEDAIPTELQPKEWPDHVLTSVVKRADNGIYAALVEHSRGVFVPGIRRFGLAERETGVSYIDIAYSGGFIDDLRPILEGLRRRIVEGEIVVPTVPSAS
jgi:basic membrane lipoprotein Med (substrate-binding protein (PBP1-ABC) superfamily)/DNA-binding SARP family transcriptional activator